MNLIFQHPRKTQKKDIKLVEIPKIKRLFTRKSLEIEKIEKPVTCYSGEINQEVIIMVDNLLW